MDLRAWLQTQPASIRNGLKIVDMPCAYHISTNPNIRSFMPQVGSRQLPTENRTVPRVCCAATLADAVRGHAAVAGQATNRWKTGQSGTFYIYQFPFREYIAPNRAIVPDVDVTKELWVVPNDPTTACFKAPIVGEFFVQSVSEEFEDGVQEHEFTLLIKTNVPVTLNERLKLDGYGCVEFKREGAINAPARPNGHVIEEITPVKAEEYAEKLAALIRNVTRG